ncbi:hypothetical protein QTO34_018203 [Cnephaeus nilssonii]|uniref:Serpin domain-containing protein n=1 Tax=Cnephaeus nilssonii TaxID=3371016 RepID=A0AA40HYD4_CNENI|nr:hypothetical protein QTO34_018203 [Eptesicus nilssonii]
MGMAGQPHHGAAELGQHPVRSGPLPHLKDNNLSGNIFISPISISSALAMVFLGARGTTEAQMSKTLHFDAVKEIHSSFQSLIADINKRGAPYILKLANRLYGEKTYEFLPVRVLSFNPKMYGAELASVDFQRASEDARKVINAWVKGQTEGKIPELLDAGVVDDRTKLVLVNAIYFKGNWQEKFSKMATTDTPFRLNKKDTKTVKMMYQKSTFPFGYIEDLKCRVLELPYQGGELSMVILLPDDIEDEATGLKKAPQAFRKPPAAMVQTLSSRRQRRRELSVLLAQSATPATLSPAPCASCWPNRGRSGVMIEEQLTLEKLHEWTKPENLSSTEVKVHLPRFKLEENYNLNSHLASLGIKDLFTTRADLSGMSRAGDLFISKIIHQSFVEVNEEGTEAAAATFASCVGCSLMPVENFVADHPFIFFIRHNFSTNILFLGRLSSP